MPKTSIKVRLIAHSRHVNRDMQQDLYWYDTVTKKMLTFKGTRLTFEYDRNTKQSIPKPVIEKIPVYQNSWEDIETVIKNNKEYVVVIEKNPGRYAILEIPDDYFWYDIEKQLKKLDIRWESYDENND